jgi:signal transduction histidine kinase
MPKGWNLRTSTSKGDFIDIAISDTGHGISEDVKDKIFLPFFTTKEKGTGLGLAIVHKIVVSHGGNISVDTGKKGTTFRIRLPLG